MSQTPKILLINPNSTETMTLGMAEVARLAASSKVRIIAKTNKTGPTSIQGAQDAIAALPGLLQEIANAPSDTTAAIIGCFDDIGLDAAQKHAPFPVFGLGHSSFAAAARLRQRFSVVTSVVDAVSIIESNIKAYGYWHYCAGVRAAGVDVLELKNADVSVIRVAAEIDKAVDEDNISAVILGCAGMGYMVAQLQYQRPVRVIEPIQAAVEDAIRRSCQS